MFFFGKTFGLILVKGEIINQYGLEDTLDQHPPQRPRYHDGTPRLNRRVQRTNTDGQGEYEVEFT